MPSASTYRCNGCTIRKQSSLLVRTIPTCVAPPLAIDKDTPPGGGQRQLRAHPDGLRLKLAEPVRARKEVSLTDYSLFGNRACKQATAGGDWKGNLRRTDQWKRGDRK
jgi:hypothetical protein